jgi:putative drug exporter of the RND superfamily
VIAFVLVLAFTLLLFAFRSIVGAAEGDCAHLLFVRAVTVLVFEHHWAEGLRGFKSNGRSSPGCPCPSS